MKPSMTKYIIRDQNHFVIWLHSKQKENRIQLLVYKQKNLLTYLLVLEISEILYHLILKLNSIKNIFHIFPMSGFVIFFFIFEIILYFGLTVIFSVFFVIEGIFRGIKLSV